MLTALKKCKLFSGIPEDELLEFLKIIKAEIVSYEKGELIFSQMDEPRKNMVLLDGSVSICNDSSMGKRNVVAIFNQPGELFGEVFVFLNKDVYGNYAQAVTNTKILEIPKEAFTLSQQNAPEFRSKMISNMMTILAQKAYFLNQRLQVISCTTLRQKIAKALLMNASSNGKTELRMNREEMADFLNTTRPSLSRELMNMQEDGLIRIEKKNINVLDIDELNNIL